MFIPQETKSPLTSALKNADTWSLTLRFVGPIRTQKHVCVLFESSNELNQWTGERRDKISKFERKVSGRVSAFDLMYKKPKILPFCSKKRWRRWNFFGV